MTLLERPPTSERASLLDGRRRALTVGLVALVSLVAFEALAVATVMPAAVRDIGGLSLYGWGFSAFMLASLVGTVAAGQAADRRGAATPFLVGAGLFCVGLLVAGLAPVMAAFILGRALQGAGAGAIVIVAYVAISRAYPDAIRARMMALLSAAWVVPALVGPAISGLLAERASWRLVFLGLLPFVLAGSGMTLSAVRRLPTASAGGPRDRRLLPAIQLAAGTGLFLFALTIERPLVATLAGVAGVAAGVPALLRLLPPGTLVARRGLPAGLAVNGLLNFGYFSAEAFVPLGLTSLRGLSTGEAGLALTAAALTWATGAWLQRLDTRDRGRGRRGRVTAGVVIATLGITIAAAAVLAQGLPVALAATGWAIGGLGMGLAFPRLNLIVLAWAPAGNEGSISGSLRVVEQVSVALGAGLCGAVIALGERAGWSEHTAIGSAFALSLLGALAAVPLSRRLPAPRNSDVGKVVSDGAILDGG